MPREIEPSLKNVLPGELRSGRCRPTAEEKADRSVVLVSQCAACNYTPGRWGADGRCPKCGGFTWENFPTIAVGQAKAGRDVRTWPGDLMKSDVGGF